MIRPLLDMNYRDLRYLIFPIIIFVFGEMVLDIFGNPLLSITIKPSNFALIEEAASRYSFFAAEMAFVIMSCGFLIYFIYDIKNTFNASSYRIIIFGYLLLCLVMAIFIWRPSLFTLPERTYWLLGKDFFETSLKSVKPFFTENLTMFDVYMLILRTMNVCAFLSVPALIMGCISSLGTTRSAEAVTGNIDADGISPDAASIDNQYAFILGYQSERLRNYLFLSSFLLVIVVVQLILWMQWPSFNLKEESKTAYESLVRSISTYYGVNYTLLLCSYYAPPSIILANRIHEHARERLASSGENLTVKNIRQWEAKMGLVVLDLKSYKIVAALISPLFPGIVGNILNIFGGGK